MFDIGRIIVVADITKIKLAILLPTTAPNAKSAWSLTTALILLANSGSEVPPATITTPIANNEIFNFLPKLTDPLITTSAPPIKIRRPIIRYKRSTK